MDEPSKPIPSSKAPSSSLALIENDFSCPRRSVNHRRTKRISRSWTTDRTSRSVSCSAVLVIAARTLLAAPPGTAYVCCHEGSGDRNGGCHLDDCRRARVGGGGVCGAAFF